MERAMFKQNTTSAIINTHQLLKLLDIAPSTLRTYELEGLVSPIYLSGERFFSQEHIIWISCIEHMINEKGISIPGLKRLLKLCPCWDITDCPNETQKKCAAKTISLAFMETSHQSIIKKDANFPKNETFLQTNPISITIN